MLIPVLYSAVLFVCPPSLVQSPEMPSVKVAKEIGFAITFLMP